MHLGIDLIPPGIFVTISIVIYLVKKWNRKRAYERLAELNDCPFKFTVDSKNGDDYVIFDLGDNAKLWCEYNFGVRSDGVYGVCDMELNGLNGTYGNRIELAIGQSVFPLIENMTKFEEWADKKAFDYKWESHFDEAWRLMKKKLDSLRFLETKSKEKEKKQK